MLWRGAGLAFLRRAPQEALGLEITGAANAPW